MASLITEFGEYDVSGNLEERRSVTRNVKRVIVNRGYNPSTFENDLALLELESPIQFDAHIVPICMPADDADYTGKMATVTGWGRLKYSMSLFVYPFFFFFEELGLKPFCFLLFFLQMVVYHQCSKKFKYQ